MTRTAILISFAIFTFIAISATACGNNATASEKKTPEVTNHAAMAHDGRMGESTQAPADNTKEATAKSTAPVKNGFDGIPAPGTKAFCPVMENEFEVKPNSPYSVYKGKTYVFCCPGCKPTFEADPEKYILKI